MEPLILQLSSSEFKDNGAKEETMKEQGLLATHIESLYVKLWLPCLIKSNLVLIAIFFCLLKLNSHSKSGRLRGGSFRSWVLYVYRLSIPKPGGRSFARVTFYVCSLCINRIYLWYKWHFEVVGRHRGYELTKCRKQLNFIGERSNYATIQCLWICQWNCIHAWHSCSSILSIHKSLMGHSLHCCVGTVTGPCHCYMSVSVWWTLSDPQVHHYNSLVPSIRCFVPLPPSPRQSSGFSVPMSLSVKLFKHSKLYSHGLCSLLRSH